MLAISKTLNYFYCVEWVPSEDGPKILKFNRYNFDQIDDFPNDVIGKIVSKFKPLSTSESNSLSFSISEKEIGISSINLDLKIDVKEYIKWYEDNVLGKYFVQNYYTFYYPMKYDKSILLMLHIKKDVRDQIISSSHSNGYNLTNMGVDIFSSNELAAKFLLSDSVKNFILWKIDNNNIHYVIFNARNNKEFNFNFLAKFKVLMTKKKINIIYSIGDKIIEQKVFRLIENIIFSRIVEIDNFADKVLLYQTKKDLSLIKKIEKKNIVNCEILDVSEKLFNEFDSKNKFEFLNYAEIGNSFRGIDV